MFLCLDGDYRQAPVGCAPTSIDLDFLNQPFSRLEQDRYRARGESLAKAARHGNSPKGIHLGSGRWPRNRTLRVFAVPRGRITGKTVADSGNSRIGGVAGKALAAAPHQDQPGFLPAWCGSHLILGDRILGDVVLKEFDSGRFGVVRTVNAGTSRQCRAPRASAHWSATAAMSSPRRASGSPCP